MTTTTPVQIRTFAEAEEVLAETLPGYEPRAEQQRLAQAVEENLAEGTILVAEAGCGTGKSLGYLIPSILSGSRVVVSTATKALQDQIANKDLPFLAESLPVEFTHAILKGRSNYFCHAEARTDESAAIPGVTEAIALAEQSDSDADFLGEQADFPMIADRDWSRVTISSEECPGASKCPFGSVCFAQRARERARSADVIVVNHALLFTDMMVKATGGGGMLDSYDAVVLDEAHEAEEYASSVLGSRFSSATFSTLGSNVRNFARKYGASEGDPIMVSVDAMLGANIALWEAIEPGPLTDAIIGAEQDAWVNMANCLINLTEALADFSLDAPDLASMNKAVSRRSVLLQRSNNARTRFIDTITGGGGNIVRWVEEERTRRGETRNAIKSAPVDVSEILRFMLWEQTPAILVSATILVDGSSNYITTRLGIDSHNVLDVGTPFNYEAQSRWYIPSNLPTPSGETRQQWETMSIETMRDLIMASGGRALVLFTSTKQMGRAFDSLNDRLPFTCRKQGDAPNRDLAEWFKEDTEGVLFATRSFMTGFDVQGESLSLVIVDKLPFPVPTDPIVEARTNAVERAGGNSFSDYTIPVMSLVLKQAHGRLIRHRNDRGVVAILDPRIINKGYGAKILRSLPSAPRLDGIADVERYFQEISS